MRGRTWRRFAIGAVAALAATPVAGCGTGGDSGPGPVDRSLKAVLAEYRPRFEQRRAALAAVAAQVTALGASGAAAASCARPVDPAPRFSSFEHTKLVLDSYNSPEMGGNVDIVGTDEAGAPEEIAEHPDARLHRFAVPPGWLIRGMWITGPQGPLGTNRFAVTREFGHEPYTGVEEDPVLRLRKILDVGLHKRYVLLYRVTTYDFPSTVTDTVTDTVQGDVVLADLETGDLPCRLVADGFSYGVVTIPQTSDGYTPYGQMQISFQLDIDSTLRKLTRP